MSDKIIDEVMELVSVLVEECDSHFFSTARRLDKTEAICAKLREVLERKPLQEGEIFNWWRGENGFEDHDMCKLQDFSEVVRAVEKRHNIK